MATNPQAEGQTKISFQISDAEKSTLQKLADDSGMKLSAYIRKVLLDAVADGVIFAHQKFSAAEFMAAAEGKGKYPSRPRPKPGKDQAG
ncbi:MAG: hypothetical protein WC205_04050 [Opitutaceae bacterium]|jgi:hypothetical protein